MKHAKTRKPWKEAHQMALSCSILVALIFATVFIVGTYVPQAPLQPRASLSLQESRQ